VGTVLIAEILICMLSSFSICFNYFESFMHLLFIYLGVEGAVRGLEGIHLADRCILIKFE
jgi:hypothetical protein